MPDTELYLCAERLAQRVRSHHRLDARDRAALKEFDKFIPLYDRFIPTKILNMNVEDRVIKCVKEQYCSSNEVTRATSFSGDLHSDSLDAVEMIMQLEDEFKEELCGKELPEEMMSQVRVVGDVVDYITNRINIE